MLRLSTFCCAVLAFVGFAASAHASDDGLIRIEPRPYYGAVVTIEHNVRVFRPLPTPRLTIINPNRTPLNVSFNHTVEHRSAVHVAAGNDGATYGGPAIYSSGHGGYAFGGNVHRPHKQRLHGEPVGPRRHTHRPRQPHH